MRVGGSKSEKDPTFQLVLYASLGTRFTCTPFSIILPPYCAFFFNQVLLLHVS